MEQLLIGFTGKRGHGKDTAALAVLADPTFQKIAFADPVRQIAGIAYQLTLHEMTDPVLKETKLIRWPYRTPREILQQIGTEMFRNFEDDTWIECFKAGVLKAEKSDRPNVVSTDVRFLNEAEAIERLGGILIRVVNPRIVQDDKASLHKSETEMDQIIVDYVVENDGSIADLHTKVKEVILNHVNRS